MLHALHLMDHTHSRPGFHLRPRDRSLLGRRERDWRSYVLLRSATLPESGDVISIGGEYIVSLGAHMTHGLLLMDKRAIAPLSIAQSIACCAILSFAIDSSVVPMHTDTSSRNVTDFAPFRASLRSAGVGSVENYFEALAAAGFAATELFDTGYIWSERLIPPRHYDASRWAHLFIPSERTLRALHLYWSGLIALPPASRILNFWRAMEAVTSLSQRRSLFAKFADAKPCSVWSHDRRESHGRRKDLASSLRRRALTRQRVLLQTGATPDDILDALYRTRRCGAAHGERETLEFDDLPHLSDQVQDAELVRFMARCAIESFWI